MGLLADIFVSTADDATKYEEYLLSDAGLPPDRYAVADYRNLTRVEFGALWAVLSNEEWDVDRHRLTPVSRSENGETCLDEFPSDLLQKLTSLEPGTEQDVLRAWAQTDKRNCPPGELAQILSDLQRLAKIARASGRGMYLWGSL